MCQQCYKFIFCLSSLRYLYGDQAKFFEAETKPRIKHKKRGTVSMANNGDNLHGSQVSQTTSSLINFMHACNLTSCEQKV